jgi:hypothetical protein
MNYNMTMLTFIGKCLFKIQKSYYVKNKFYDEAMSYFKNKYNDDHNIFDFFKAFNEASYGYNALDTYYDRFYFNDQKLIKFYESKFYPYANNKIDKNFEKLIKESVDKTFNFDDKLEKIAESIDEINDKINKLNKN